MKSIKLKNTTLNVHPRTVFDVLSAEELSKRDSAKEWPASLYTFINHSSLRRNLDFVPWYRFIKRFQIRKLVSIQSLVRLLSLSEMNRIIIMIHEAEELSQEVHDG